MYDNRFEKHTPQADRRTPEEIEQDNRDRQEVLGDMYAADRFVSDGRTGLDSREVFDVVDDQSLAQTTGVDEARTQIADVYNQIATDGSAESAALYAQEATIAARVVDIIGDDVDEKTVAVRVGAEMINNMSDGSADIDNRAQLGAGDMAKVVHATAAAELIDTLESDPAALDRLTPDTRSRLYGFMQTVRNSGGVEKTSNADLEEAGRYVLYEPEVQEVLEEPEVSADTGVATPEAVVETTDATTEVTETMPPAVAADLTRKRREDIRWKYDRV